MKVVRIGVIVLFLFLIGASLGLAFFRQIDGANLRTLIRERQALEHQLAQKDIRIKELEDSMNSLNVELAQRDEQINQLRENHADELAKRDQQIKRLRASHAGELAQQDQQIKQLRASHADELAQRDKRIGELEQAVGNAR